MAVEASYRRAAGTLAGGGEMGTRMRAFGWTDTALGAPENWSRSLKTAVRIMLTSRQPMWIGWGRDLIFLYNDPYKSIIGGKHPWALGRPTSEVWQEIWEDIRPMLASAMTGAEGTYDEDKLLIMERHGYPEETYYTFSYSPIPDDDGTTGGIICANTDETQRVIGERQLALLRELASATDARTSQLACERSARALGTDPHDFPFAMLYIAEAGSTNLSLAGLYGVEPRDPIAPKRVSALGRSHWPIGDVFRKPDLRLVSDLPAIFGADIPTGAWTRPPDQAAVVPIPSSGDTGRAGVLIAGLNPYRLFDERYQGFLGLVAGQISAALANAQAYEQERRRAEALAEIDRAKTVFFSNVSHEFRTPLTLMLGPLEEALAAPPMELPQRREDLALVHRSALRLLRLVNTLLDFSRIEADRAHATYEPVNFAALTSDLASNFRSACQRAGLRLVVECLPLPEPVWVDREMWEKIVLNLISNAFKFTFEGEITVRVRQEGGSAVLVIEDTGTGIPEDEIPRLFDRFHRVEGAQGRTHEGTGIGLALVQELAKLHGGVVRAQSVLGEGSTFTVTIPLGQAHLPPERVRAERTLVSTALVAQPYVEEALRWLPGETWHGAFESEIEREILPEPPLLVEVVGERATVLLADDNVDMRDYIRRLLAPRYEVRTAADGAAALSALRRRRPDLLLSDVMMPHLDGFKLVREIRADRALADLPVILLSARAGEEESVEGLEAGADDYLTKPFSARELLARVRANLELARIRREAKLQLAADLHAMTRLREVGEQCLLTGNEFARCLDAVLDAAIAITGADKGNIQLLDAESGMLEIAAQRGFERPFLSFFANVGVGEAAVCGAALQSASRVIVEDVTQNEIFTGQPSLDILLEAGVRALQSTPLVGRAGTVFGMISTHFSRPHRPSERDLRLMDLLARQTADYIERRKAEAAARALSVELKQILDTSATGLTHCSREMRYVTANPAYAKVAGLPLEQIIGRSIAEVMGEKAFATVRPYIERALQGERVEYEIELPWAARGSKWTHFVYTPCRENDGTISGWIASVRDISERKRSQAALRELNEHLEQKIEERTRALEAEIGERQKAEAMLQQAQRLEAIGQLTGGVAHDFNNLLTVILGNIDLLRSGSRGAVDSSRLIDAMQSAAEHGAQLTSQLLAFSRHQQLQPITLSVQRSILGIEDLVRRAVSEAVTVDISADSELWPARVDPARFKSALLNLAVNARDAMAEGGRLVISARNVTVGEFEASRLDIVPGDYVRVNVTDNGAGMVPDVLRRAFEPFFTTKDIGKGTGLGLAQVYGFAKQSRGTATIDSALGNGTTVALYFPRADLGFSEEQPSTIPREAADGRGKTILVVEDQPELLRLIGMFLDGLDYRILTAADGVAARKLLETDEKVDLLLTDAVMPNGLSGIDLARYARRLRQDLKIVMMSGYVRESGADALDALEDLVFLEKPFRRAKLAETISAALNGGGR